MRSEKDTSGAMKGIFFNSGGEPCDLHGGRAFDLGERCLS